MHQQPYTIGRLKGECCLVFYGDNGKRRRHRLGTSDPRKAHLIAPAVYAELNRPAGRKVEDLWGAYTEDKAGRAIIPTMGHTWKALRDRFGHREPETITSADCRAHTAARREAGIKDGTIHTELGHLRMVLLWAKDQKLIAEAPRIERPSKPRHTEKHLTREEVRRLFKSDDYPHVKLAAVMLYTTAARVSALLELTWDRVDFHQGRIHLENPKITRNHKGRSIVPMLNSARPMLLHAKSCALSPTVIEWGGKPVASIKKGLASAGRKAGLPMKVTPHMLRHSAAVHMAEDDVGMDQISQFLGHSNVEITRRVYARFSPSFLKKAAGALEFDDEVV